MFQRLLDTQLGTPAPSFHRNLIVATQRLAGKSGLYPVCYELTDVTTVGNHCESSGAFADIYKGSFQGRAVCLKTIRLDKKTQMEHLLKVCSKEAILWGQLSHPNLLPFYGIFSFNGRISFVAPWMVHGDITEYLKNHPTANRVLLVFDTVEGLRFLHKNGIVHGDLKGPNILVNEAGRACVSDFGLSSVSDKDILAWTSFSSIGSKGGTVRWQSPELFDPEGEDDIRNTLASDMYAWSCVVYEIFTGHIPFAHISRDTVVMLKVGNGERPARPPESSPSWTDWGLTEYIWTLMQDCWKTDPQERPTIDVVRDRLIHWVLPLDTRPGENGSTLSPVKFREMTREGRNHDEMSVDTLDSLMNAS